MKEFLDVEEARALLLTSLFPPDREAECVPTDTARHRVTADTVRTTMDVPPFRASAMDGYAVCSTDPVFMGAAPHRVRVEGASRAGHPPRQPLPPDCAMRIFTGAVVPERSDAIIIQENATVEESFAIFSETPRPGRWVRAAGHDVAAGSEILPAGRLLGAFDLAALAACGISSLDVRPRLRVAIFSTGDELEDTGSDLAPGHIYDANRLVLKELLSSSPVLVTDLGILADDADLTRRTLDRAARTHDLILTSGGVSVGEADFVRDAVEQVGRLDFWKIALRPGKPLAYGRIHDCVFFGLPGNPVSTIVTFLLIVKPALQRLAGMTAIEVLRIPAIAQAAIEHEPGRSEYQRGVYHYDGTDIVVRPTGDQSSNRIGSFNGANCLIELPKENPGVLAGARVQVLPFEGLLG